MADLVRVVPPAADVQAGDGGGDDRRAAGGVGEPLDIVDQPGQRPRFWLAVAVEEDKDFTAGDSGGGVLGGRGSQPRFVSQDADLRISAFDGFDGRVGRGVVRQHDFIVEAAERLDDAGDRPQQGRAFVVSGDQNTGLHHTSPCLRMFHHHPVSELMYNNTGGRRRGDKSAAKGLFFRLV